MEWGEYVPLLSWPLLFLLPLSHSPTSHWAGGRKTCSFGQLESLEWSAFLVVLSSLAEVSSSSFQCPHETFRPQDATHSKPQRWLPYALSYDFPSGSCWENPSYTGLCQKKKSTEGWIYWLRWLRWEPCRGRSVSSDRNLGAVFREESVTQHLTILLNLVSFLYLIPSSLVKGPLWYLIVT